MGKTATKALGRRQSQVAQYVKHVTLIGSQLRRDQACRFTQHEEGFHLDAL